MLRKKAAQTCSSPLSGDFSSAALAKGVSEDLLALSDPETLRTRLRAWLGSDARAQQLWSELEHLGTVARCDANKELLKVLIPLAQYVLGLELQQLGEMRALVQRPAAGGKQKAAFGKLSAPALPEPEPESPGLQLDLAGLLKDVAAVPPVDASPIRRLARALKDENSEGCVASAAKGPGREASEERSVQGDRAGLTALARKVHRVLGVGPEKSAAKDTVVKVRARTPLKRVQAAGEALALPVAATPTGSESPTKAASPKRGRSGSVSPVRRRGASSTRFEAALSSHATLSDSRTGLPTASAAAVGDDRARAAGAKVLGHSTPKELGADAGVQTDITSEVSAALSCGADAQGMLDRDSAPSGVDGRITGTGKGRKKASGSSKKELEEKDAKAADGSSATADPVRKRKPTAKLQPLEVPSRPATADLESSAVGSEARNTEPRRAFAGDMESSRIRALEDENRELRELLTKERGEKAKLNLELEELKLQVDALLKRLRQEGGEALATLLEKDEFASLVEKRPLDDVFHRLYQDALARIERFQELRQRVQAEHERELQRTLPTMAWPSRGKLERPQKVPGLEVCDPASLTDAELFCEEALQCLRTAGSQCSQNAGFAGFAERPLSRTAPVRRMTRRASGPLGNGSTAWCAPAPGMLEVAGSRKRIEPLSSSVGPFSQTFPTLPALETTAPHAFGNTTLSQVMM
jgi:hypothetical protein